MRSSYFSNYSHNFSCNEQYYCDNNSILLYDYIYRLVEFPTNVYCDFRHVGTLKFQKRLIFQFQQKYIQLLEYKSDTTNILAKPNNEKQYCSFFTYNY